MAVAEKPKNDLIEAMFGAGAHYGYSKSKRHPSLKAFIYGAKNQVEIFDLEKTSKTLTEALDFVSSLASKGKTLLFVSGKREAKDIIKTGALSVNMPYVAGRWIGGTITNFKEIKKRIDKFLDLKEKREKGELTKYTKKERLLIDREILDLETKFEGLSSLKGLPDAIFVIDSKKEQIAVTEAKTMGIPVVSLSSSDCNIGNIDYPIPGNDSSVSSIKFFVSKITEAYKSGVKSS